MSNSAMARLDNAINKFDAVLAERLRRERAAMEHEKRRARRRPSRQG